MQRNKSNAKKRLSKGGLYIRTYLLLVLIAIFVTGRTQSITKPNIIGPSGLQVNSYTGGLFIQRTDFSLKGQGLSLDMTFSYNSADRNNNWGFGFGWTFMYNHYYSTDSTGVTFYNGDGRGDKYNLGNGVYVSPIGIYDRLIQYETNKFRLHTKAGLEYYFENPIIKKLTRIKDRNGNEITLTYTGSQLGAISDAFGRTFKFIYSNDRVVELKADFGGATRSVKYTYDSTGCLSSVTDPMGYVSSYSYGRNRLLTGLSDKNANANSITYNLSSAVTKIVSCMSELMITYNTAQIKTHVTEKNNDGHQVTTYAFDTLGRLIEREGNCCGFKNVISYDGSNNISSIQDANGNRTVYSYDNAGNLLAETDPMGNSVQYAYDSSFNELLSTTDKKGGKTTYEYDVKGNLVQINMPLNTVRKYAYDNTGKRIDYTSPKGSITRYSYDHFGYLSSVTDALGGVVKMSNDPWGNIITQTDEKDNKTTLAYDALNRLVVITDALEGNTKFTYDGNGNETSFTDANGNKMAFTYDANDKRIYATDALGNITSLKHDGFGNLVVLTDANGGSTRFSYDNMNRLIGEINAAGEQTRFRYDGNGNNILVSKSNGNEVITEYDALNRPTKLSDNMGVIESYIYDANGNRVSTVNSLGIAATFNYDALNRVTREVDALGNSTVFEYDANGNKVKVTDRNGHVTRYVFDDLDRRYTLTDPQGYTTRYAYDIAGNLESITDAKGNKTLYSFDALNRNTSELFANATSKQYKYDAVGNLTSRLDNKGVETKYIYDKNYRLINRIYPNSYDSISYDGIGNVLSAKNSQSSILFTYDLAGRLLSETLNGKTTAYTYNVSTRKKTITYPGGRVVEREMDFRDQLRSIYAEGSVVVRFEYDAAGHNISRAIKNNTSTSRMYNGNGQVRDLSHSPSQFVHLRYSYDKEGNPATTQFHHNSNNSEQYSYDKLNQLTGFKKGAAHESVFNYDEIGNRTSAQINGVTATYKVNNTNAYTDIYYNTRITYTYDGNGNLASDGTRSFTYDAENRITEVNGRGTVAKYVYDAFGRRIQKVSNGVITNYYFDGLQIVEERDAADLAKATYLWGTWVDDVVSMNRQGKNYYYHANTLGSVLSITDSLGAVVESYEYDPFGGLSMYDGLGNSRTASSIENTYTYTGREYESETGLYNYRARSYDPISGRFLQTDPLGYVDGMGLYTYVRNKPTLMNDPLGLKGNSCMMPRKNNPPPDEEYCPDGKHFVGVLHGGAGVLFTMASLAELSGGTAIVGNLIMSGPIVIGTVAAPVAGIVIGTALMIYGGYSMYQWSKCKPRPRKSTAIGIRG